MDSIRNSNSSSLVFPSELHPAIICVCVGARQEPESETDVPLLSVRAIDGDRGDNATINYRVDRVECISQPPVQPMACQQRSDQHAQRLQSAQNNAMCASHHSTSDVSVQYIC